MPKSMTRRDTAARKETLANDLRAMGRSSELIPGDMMLSVRELAAQYELSIQTVSAELKKLADEGVLYTIPRVGTFVGRPKQERGNLFLAIFRYLDKPNTQWSALHSGFEERITTLGGTSLVLDFETARRYFREGHSIAPAGVFEFHDHENAPIWADPNVPRVEFGETRVGHEDADTVNFDNRDGGWQATRHLLALGHTRIALLGMHFNGKNPNFILWSQEREEGWRRALREAGHSAEGLAIYANEPPIIDIDYLMDKAVETAETLLQRNDYTAVVAVNAYAAKGLFKALRRQRRPVEQWPAVVGFDRELTQNTDDAMRVLSSLRLPWEEVGREIANLLWERSKGRLDAQRQTRLVPMSLIPRLSCRGEWSRVPVEVAASEESVISLI